MAGAALGLGVALALMGWFCPDGGFSEAFVIGFGLLLGIVAGRIFSAAWAKRKLDGILAILYQQENPLRFLECFAPIVEKTPRQTVEYVDGMSHLAYAYEALGEYDESLELLEQLHPENLKLHQLVARSLVANQKMRLWLLKNDCEMAEKQLEILRELAEAAKLRAPAVGENITQCIRLGEVWLECLKGDPEHLDYIREEKALAKNWVHREEMEKLEALFGGMGE